MARRNKNKIILEDVELKPQVIGYTYQKKSNLGRVIFVFAIFILAVFYIDEISVYINEFIGKDTAQAIKQNAEKNKQDKKPEVDNQEIVYNIVDVNLSIKEEDLLLNNFEKENNKLKFDVTNNAKVSVNYSLKKYYVETYTENKTLIERVKIDIPSLTPGDKITNEVELRNDFYYLVFVEKNNEDYPAIELQNDDTGNATLTCIKDNDTLVYTFKDMKLQRIEHKVINNDTTNTDYYNKYYENQAKINMLKEIDGVTANFSGSLSGFSSSVLIELSKANLSKVKEKYYYGYNEEAKVVSFEMQTYGFVCN